MDLYAGLKIDESESGDYHLLEPISSLTGQGQFALCEDGSGNKFVCPEDFWLHHAPKPETTAPVHADSTSQENIDFFLSLFRGRDSLYARRYYSSYIDVLVQENLIGSRFKSEDSIIRKYGKTLRTGGGFKQCFNDVLGFRLRFGDYPEEYPDYFRVVDLRKGKKIDDGYQAIHLYYQRDNLAYPIEAQLWCGKDFSFSIWSHQYVYKYKTPEVGKLLYQEYSTGMIRTEQEFLARLQELEAV